MILVHRRELIRQTVATLRKHVTGVAVGVEAAGWPSVPWAPLQVGGVQSVVRRPNIRTPDLVIVDEAHHVRAATWEKVLARWPNAAVVGLTATPQRLDGKGLGEHFREMVTGPTIQELVAEGYLAPNPHPADQGTPSDGGCQETLWRLLPEGTRGARHGRGGRRRGGCLPAIRAGPAGHFLRRDGRGTPRRWSRRRTGAGSRRPTWTGPTIRRAGTGSSRSSGRATSRSSGNCELYGEGVDAPGCDCVLFGTATQSITKYMQAAGRAMRPGPGQDGAVPRPGRVELRAWAARRRAGVEPRGRRGRGGAREEAREGAGLRAVRHGVPGAALPPLRA